MKHLNPRQGITTYHCPPDALDRLPLGVKHLNPRQGITTEEQDHRADRQPVFRVKHLNPRQGITTSVCDREYAIRLHFSCETPKSPPGDYNSARRTNDTQHSPRVRVKHLNPRQGITTEQSTPQLAQRAPVSQCETPKSPPGDYNWP